jgi:hypothetical protein
VVKIRAEFSNSSLEILELWQVKLLAARLSLWQMHGKSQKLLLARHNPRRHKAPRLSSLLIFRPLYMYAQAQLQELAL